MATEIVIYTVVHQPRRIKLPAQPIPDGASAEDIVRCVFDERMNERYFRKVANTCYYPATEMWLRLVNRGVKLAIGFSVSFLEEMWARNLANIMMSPLRPVEFIAALMIMSIIRLAIGMVPVTLLAIGFFGFNLWSLGFALAAFFLNLILTSWSIGIFVAGLLLRNGMGAESMAWTIMFLFLPLTCVYYPVDVLPHWLQYVAWALPPTYVFEGMRALLIQHVFRADLMLQAFGFNLLLFAAASTGFLSLLRSAREQGSLLQGGE